MSCQCDTRDPETQLDDCRALVSLLDEPRAAPASLDLFLLIEADGLRRPGALTPGDGVDVALDMALADVAQRHHGRAFRMSEAIYAIVLDTPAAAPAAAVAVAVDAAVSETAPWLGRRIVHERSEIPAAGGHGAALAYSAFEALGRRLARAPRSPGRQARDVLLQALCERRHAGPAARQAQVSSLAVSVGRMLRLSNEELDDAVRAAELQDLGLAVLPDAIRLSRGRLSEAQWALVRRHPVVGERIIAAAPALASVARLVRSCYERFDGSGYPDGLSGEEIPLGSRIIAVCVAFDAMTADRPHRVARSREAALAELEECAGTQFDPQVVAAVCRLVRACR